ncbi:MAG TPA: helix-turn-helix domain-containing protein [Blastocatellia bacterium]|nr:helix-turn-helix domain-containing protein [Blastocatellia bacterium]
MAEIRRLTRADERKFLTIEEAAQVLGVKTTALRNYLYEGKMTTYKFKTLTLLKVDEVEAWKYRQKSR